MKKILVSILLILLMTLIMLPTAAFADTAVPSKTNFVMNGKSVSVTATYSINDTNYLQLRAIAAMLNGTPAQFDVGWDGQYAVIEPGKPYSGTITEIKLQDTTDVRKSRTRFKMKEEVFTFSDARLINGDTNYIQLREFAQKLSGTTSQFNVYWDGGAGQAVIQPGVAYTGNGPQSSTIPKRLGGTKRTINLDNLLTIEISNAHSYARVLAYDPVGANIIHYVIVSEGAEIKCTRYVPPYDTVEWQDSEYMIAPYSNIYFENGALWPTVTYSGDYDDREWAKLAQGKSITAVNGEEYIFEASSSDPAITGKYGNVGAAIYVLRIFVVPDEIAAKIGGSAPKIYDQKSTLQEYYVPSGAGSAPVTYITDPNAPLLSSDGWYELLYDHVYDVMGLTIDAQGNAELREGIEFYAENKGNNQVTFRMADGRYLGIEGTPVNGVRAKAVNSPYLWNIYFENNAGFFDNNRYSLRPSTNTGLVLTASGAIKEGTLVNLASQTNMDAPKNAEFTFFPTDAPKSGLNWDKGAEKGVNQPGTGSVSSDKLEEGTYYIKSSKKADFVMDVNGASKEDGAKLIIYKNNGGNNQKFKISQVKDNQYTIQSVHSGKWLKSNGTKGGVLTQSGSETDKSKVTFTIIKQEDGTCRIMDSKGFYLGISGGKIENGTNIILWTEASDASQTYIFEKIK